MEIFLYLEGERGLLGGPWLGRQGKTKVCGPVASLSPQEAIQLDGEILFSLLQKVSPVAHKHLSQQKIDPLLYMTEWFMCAFSRTLPWSSVLRVWDMFFCEGTGLGSGQHPCHQSSSRGGLCLQRNSPEQPPPPTFTACPLQESRSSSGWAWCC